jgi:hypothetical protein
MTLGDLIDLQIKTQGPMSIATYMALCLTHPSRAIIAPATLSVPRAISSRRRKSARCSAN